MGQLLPERLDSRLQECLLSINVELAVAFPRFLCNFYDSSAKKICVFYVFLIKLAKLGDDLHHQRRCLFVDGIGMPTVIALSIGHLTLVVAN